MLEKIKEKVLRKFKFVQELGTDRDIFRMQYMTEKQCNENVMECCRKQQEEINTLKADKDQMESLFAYTICNTHIISGIGDGRHIFVTPQGIQDAAGMQIEIKKSFPIDGFAIYSRKK